jgi:hypothetical protein
MNKLSLEHSFISKLPNMWALFPQQQKPTKFQWIENAQPTTHLLATRIAFETPRAYHHLPKWPLKFIFNLAFLLLKTHVQWQLYASKRNHVSTLRHSSSTWHHKTKLFKPSTKCHFFRKTKCMIFNYFAQQ